MTIRIAAGLAGLALAAALAAAPARALAPEQMSYQGVLVQNNGIAVPNGVYDLRFRLYDHATAGTIVFEQTLATQVTSGLYNVILSNNGGYDLGDVVAGNSQLFMQVTILASPPAVPSDVTLLPRQQLASVPYALASIPPDVTVEASSLAHTNSSNAQTSATAWTVVPGLEGLSFDVPYVGCVLEVRAEVVLSATNNGRVVGARLERSLAGSAYTPVRGPVVVTVGNGQPSTATVSHLVVDPAPGSSAYRVTTREDSDQSYIVSPVVGALSSESRLSGVLTCPGGP